MRGRGGRVSNRQRAGLDGISEGMGWDEQAAAVPAPGLPGEGGTASGTAEPFPNPCRELCQRYLPWGLTWGTACDPLPLRDPASSALIPAALPLPSSNCTNCSNFTQFPFFPTGFEVVLQPPPGFASLPRAAARGNEMRIVRAAE